MQGKQITRVFLLILIIAIVVFDVFIIGKYGRSASISWVIITEAKTKYPLLNDLLFFTLGHLFWRMKRPVEEVSNENDI